MKKIICGTGIFLVLLTVFLIFVFTQKESLSSGSTPDSNAQTEKTASVSVTAGRPTPAASGSSADVHDPVIKDHKPPVIKGILKKESIVNTLPILTVYSDKKDNFDYTQLIRVKDKRDKHPQITVDTSRVNFRQTGRYRVYFIAKDAAGNTARSWSYIQVIVPGDLESYEDQILAEITQESDSKARKIRAIYRYLITHISYTSDGNHGYWYDVATESLLFGTGDCYAYYAAAHALLSRAGITDLMVKRYPCKPGMNHWWNLIHIKNKWYHFECMPHDETNAVLCLVTTRQLQSSFPGYFRFDWRLYPRISRIEFSSLTKKHTT
ncbi:MAG: transglutaminase domain-containing protein [Eubacterium sp.]|nr:transglutaminase domain-containing protein [Eubacterium sp.]